MGSDSTVVGAYSYLWLGALDARRRGVGMAISTRLSECDRQVTPVDERLEHTCGFMTVAAVYAPPGDHLLRDKEEFYHKLELLDGRRPDGDVLVVLVDLNAETGSDMAGYE